MLAWLPSRPTAVSAHSPSTVARPRTVSPRSVKKEIVASRSRTAMPTISSLMGMRCTLPSQAELLRPRDPALISSTDGWPRSAVQGDVPREVCRWSSTGAHPRHPGRSTSADRAGADHPVPQPPDTPGSIRSLLQGHEADPADEKRLEHLRALGDLRHEADVRHLTSRVVDGVVDA